MQIGSKVILTIHSTEKSLMLMYLLESQTEEEVNKKINWIKDILGKELYSKIFHISLTDNGSEFKDYNNFEHFNNEKVCNLFYCDPGHPEQKGACEENHHYIRYFFPKGKCDFDTLTQDDCNKLMSHINSVPRECLNNETPYNCACLDISAQILEKLGCTKIEADDVILSATLFDGRGLKSYKKINNK